jgi:hypothetical protein
MKHVLLLAFSFSLLIQVADGQTAATKRTKSKKHTSKPTYYHNSDGSVSDRPQKKPTSDAKRPSAYKGDNVPENDGPKKNEQRNINYNSGQPLPSNSGK